MDLKLLLTGLTPRQYGDLTVDNTTGGVGFDPDKLTCQSLSGLPAKVVRYTVEGGDMRTREVGVPTASSGDLLMDGDEAFVVGLEAISNWRAIRTGADNATVRYHVYF